jgi:hypothetical protein
MFDDVLSRFEFPAAARSDRAVSKSFAAVTKSVEAQVQPVEDTGNPNGEFVLIAGDFDPDAWMPLPARVHVDTDYGSADGLSVPNTAGSGVPEITDDGDLIVRGTWASTPHAQMTRQLVNEGHVWAASLLYLTHADGRRELLNGTFAGVPDPDMPKGIVLSSKARSVDGRVDVDPVLLRSVHDLAVVFGAECRCGAKQSTRKRRTNGRDQAATRAATMWRAHARARKFALDQDLMRAVMDAESV